MKKIWAVYAGILISVFVVFSLCDLKSDYLAERQVWRIDQKLQKYAREPQVIPRFSYEQLISSYRRVIKQFPESYLCPKIYTQIAGAHFLKKDYEAARAEYQVILEKYPQNTELLTRTQFNIAKTYEAAGQWSQALRVYDSLKKDHEQTIVGMSVPLYLADHYQRQGEGQLFLQAAQEAVEQYQSLIARFPDSAVEFNASQFLSDVYVLQKRWTEGVEARGKILLKFIKTTLLNQQSAAVIIQRINNICLEESQDFGPAIKIYRQFIEQNPQHPLAGSLKQVVFDMERLQEKQGTQ